MLDFNFILDEEFLAYFILHREMHNESSEISSFKKTIENERGYKIICGNGLLDIYYEDKEIMEVINNLINSDLFEELYKKYNNESKELIAVKLLDGRLENRNEQLDILKEELWFKYMNGYKKIINLSFSNYNLILKDKNVKLIIDELKSTDEFLKLKTETIKYIELLNTAWAANKNQIIEYLKDTLKSNFNLHLDVYVTHPNTYTGFTLNNYIFWGHYKGLDDINYNLTYLIHEFLHCYLSYLQDETIEEQDIKHTIIEFISDYELYSKLSNESKWMVGHEELNKYRSLIYPYWLDYIGLSLNEKKERMEEDKVDFEIIEDNLSEYNINEFIDYTKNKLLIKTNKDLK